MTKQQQAQRYAQREAQRTGIGVNDGYGNIWYPPSACDKGVPVRQPDYGRTYRS